jgi:peptide/nickel transport system permease protein
MNGRYLVNKFARAFLTIVAIILINFLLFRAMPGSAARLTHSPYQTQAQIDQETHRLGLDQPLLPISISIVPPDLRLNAQNQLFAYVGQTLSGDLGYSFKYKGQPVVQVIADRFWPTILLIGLGEVLAIIIGLALGAYAGWRRGSAVDRIGGGLGLILYSMPYFVIGMPLIIIFAAGLGWFPTSGMSTVGATYDSAWAQVYDFLRHLVLPLATVSLGLIGGYSILMRAAIVETRGEDYVTTARAKGLTDGRILRSHAFPNAMLPMVTIIAINLGWVVGGAITAEVVFNWPGLGTLTVDALSARDYPVLQGIFLLIAVTVVVANLIADAVYGLLDPRVRS